MAISRKTQEEIVKMRKAGKLVAEAFAFIAPLVVPGATLISINEAVENFLKENDAEMLYKGYRGSVPSAPPFPSAICASLNEEICHGIPDERTLKEGDLLKIDIGLRLDGYCGDACVTYPVGTISEEAQALIDATKRALSAGIKAVKVGKHFGEVGYAIETSAQKNGFEVVSEWGGHGIGKELHEDPSVSHVGPRNIGPLIDTGMVFTIEPMLTVGEPDWLIKPDGWTVVTKDGSLSAQFEHTLAVTEKGVEVLTVR